MRTVLPRMHNGKYCKAAEKELNEAVPGQEIRRKIPMWVVGFRYS